MSEICQGDEKSDNIPSTQKLIGYCRYCRPYME